MEVKIFGYTGHDLPILAYQFTATDSNYLQRSLRTQSHPRSNHISIDSRSEVLILGGVHGDEPEGVAAGLFLLEKFKQDYNFRFNLTLVPQFNIEGVIKSQRTNWNGVDLNRNLPTKDWSPEIKTPRYNPGPFSGSEPENQYLIKYLSDNKPALIISLHSWHPLLNINGDCLHIAKKIASKTDYKIEEDIGYPTPGCLGTYAGLERNIPTITYEIERGIDLKKIKDIHIDAITEGLNLI